VSFWLSESKTETVVRMLVEIFAPTFSWAVFEGLNTARFNAECPVLQAKEV
jgi:hypothetical protein